MHRVGLVLTLAVALAAPTVWWTPPAEAAPVAVPYDFDADGHPDLVVGAPGLQVKTSLAAGGVVVIPSDATSPGRSAEVITAATSGVPGDAETNAYLGAVLDSGDFDGDGHADLAIGLPNAAQSGQMSAGAVLISYGSADGLTGSRWQRLVEPDEVQSGAAFGASLAVADVDGDGRSDLAVGTPRADAATSYLGSGALSYFPGTKDGLSSSRYTVVRGHRSVPGPEADQDDQFATTLAFGDIDQDGYPDLVVGATGVVVGDGTGIPGSVSVCYGTPEGVTGCTQLDRRLAYGNSRTLAVGNVSGGARPEIIVGGQQRRGSNTTGGAVEILSLSGRRDALSIRRVQLTQTSPGVPGRDRAGDFFGADLAVGDLDEDGYADLVIGDENERVHGHAGAGQVIVVYGGRHGYRTHGARSITQDTTGVPGRAEDADNFGTVGLHDFDADGHLDLVIGAPGENEAEGLATLLRGTGSSVTTRGARTFSLRQLGSVDPHEAFFGAALISR